MGSLSFPRLIARLAASAGVMDGAGPGRRSGVTVLPFRKRRLLRARKNDGLGLRRGVVARLPRLVPTMLESVCLLNGAGTQPRQGFLCVWWSRQAPLLGGGRPPAGAATARGSVSIAVDRQQHCVFAGDGPAGTGISGAFVLFN